MRSGALVWPVEHSLHNKQTNKQPNNKKRFTKFKWDPIEMLDLKKIKETIIFYGILSTYVM